MFVKERFKLSQASKDLIYGMTPKFGYNGFGELLFYRTYSRTNCNRCKGEILYNPDLKEEYCPNCESWDKGQENWSDVVVRVIEGTFSIRKDWYIKNHIHWDQEFWNHYAHHKAISLFKMEWMPPGRGLWAMGSNFVYQRGSMALQNCGLTTITDDIGADISWLMDAMMCGVGVGFIPIKNDMMKAYRPSGTYEYIIPDTREGWCKATELIIDSYVKPGRNKVKCVYDLIRPGGLPIRGFGGISSGPEPLIKYHELIHNLFSDYTYYSVRLKADLANAAGCCIVSGNVRRSAELCAGFYDDIKDLKDYNKYPYREAWGGMSNNSVFLKDDIDFERLDEIAERVKINAEPGYINLRNLPFGRIGKNQNDIRHDYAIGFNPCGEQPLENRELCTLAESCPSISFDPMLSMEYACVYASTVTLLPTHSERTNAVMSRNRRIGVGIIDVVGWNQNIGTTNLIKNLRQGYERVRSVNNWLNDEAGVPRAIRVTTVKPGGTTPKLPGLRSGWGWPTFDYTLRRMRIAQNSPVCKLLIDHDVPHEPDRFSPLTEVFEYPIDQCDGGRIKPATQISLWQQAMMLVLLQREWSDNAVSNTLYFRPKWPLTFTLNVGDSFYWCDLKEEIKSQIVLDEKAWENLVYEWIVESDHDRLELKQDRWSDNYIFNVYTYDENHEEDDIEPVLAAIAPLTKSVALSPHSANGVYIQTPEEGISEDKYLELLKAIRPIDWSKLIGSDGIDEKFCQGASCEVIQK